MSRGEYRHYDATYIPNWHVKLHDLYHSAFMIHTYELEMSRFHDPSFQAFYVQSVDKQRMFDPIANTLVAR